MTTSRSGSGKSNPWMLYALIVVLAGLFVTVVWPFLQWLLPPSWERFLFFCLCGLGAWLLVKFFYVLTTPPLS